MTTLRRRSVGSKAVSLFLSVEGGTCFHVPSIVGGADTRPLRAHHNPGTFVRIMRRHCSSGATHCRVTARHTARGSTGAKDN